MKRVVILGSTGSVGKNACRVAEALRDRVQVVGIAAKSNVGALAEQAGRLGCSHACIGDASLRDALAAALPEGCRALAGPEGLLELARLEQADMILCAIVGTGGLLPVIAALEARKEIALASKEVLVMAGSIVMPMVKRYNSRMIPVDSEHSAIFQCLGSRAPHNVARLILTASGGPFRNAPRAEMEHATWKRALAHPTWSMGEKVSLDSATLMNKALEMVEASFLFDVPESRIDVVVHPQSIVHSMVEFTDGVLIAQMSMPDMRFPIQYAFTFPERCPGGLERLDLARTGKLEFEAPDTSRFPSLDFARTALRAGGTMPCVMNAANEVAFARFKKGEIPFTGIWSVIEKTMEAHRSVAGAGLADILAADRWAREKAASVTVRRQECSLG